MGEFYSNAFHFLDQHPWLATAAAAAVTAIATIFIARYSRATLRLFELEKERHKAIEARIVGECAHFLAQLKIQKSFAQAVRSSPILLAMLPPGKHLETISSLLDVHIQRVQDLQKEAQRVSAETVRYVRQAEHLTVEAMVQVGGGVEALKVLQEHQEEGEDEALKVLNNVWGELQSLIDHLESNKDVQSEAAPLISSMFETEDGDQDGVA